jgi:hypothetical protein
MEIKKQHSGEITIDYSTSSVEVFPALSVLGNSDNLYFKFSKNRFKFREHEETATELLLDFDLCLIDRATNDTVMQLFAVFVISAPPSCIKDFETVEQAINFGKEMVSVQIREQDLKDTKGDALRLPVFDINPDSVKFLG